MRAIDSVGFCIKRGNSSDLERQTAEYMFCYNKILLSIIRNFYTMKAGKHYGLSLRFLLFVKQ